MAQASTICAGIDAGSRAIKVVLWDPRRMLVLAAGAVDQGVAQESLALELLDRLLCGAALGRGDLGAVVATGYGRKLIRLADRAVTEITCQAWGVRQRSPGVRTIIDIGGQDSKVLRLAADGSIDDFVMNDRCAAGSGRFLEVLADRLAVALPALGQLARDSRKPALISSMCVVFAETEIVGLLASGMAPADIVAGVQTSVARRIAAMVGQHPPAPIVLTGGVAMIPGMDCALAAALGVAVAISPEPQFTGALGAAVLASQRLDGKNPPAL
jgi:predicted CoA-substrate-specific enzyme activase